MKKPLDNTSREQVENRNTKLILTHSICMKNKIKHNLVR